MPTWRMQYRSWKLYWQRRRLPIRQYRSHYQIPVFFLVLRCYKNVWRHGRIGFYFILFSRRGQPGKLLNMSYSCPLHPRLAYIDHWNANTRLPLHCYTVVTYMWIDRRFKYLCRMHNIVYSSCLCAHQPTVDDKHNSRGLDALERHLNALPCTQHWLKQTRKLTRSTDIRSYTWRERESCIKTIEWWRMLGVLHDFHRYYIIRFQDETETSIRQIHTLLAFFWQMKISINLAQAVADRGRTQIVIICN